MADTWQDLERRFHQIGDRPGKVVLDFNERDAGRYWWTLSGPVINGGCRIAIVGRCEPKPDYSTDHYSVNEISDLLQRAGRLMLDDDPKDIWAGADRFVAMTIRTFQFEVCREDERTFFPNAGAILGIMAGQMLLAVEPDLEQAGQKILDENRGIKQREFCRAVGISNKVGGELYRKLTGKEKQSRNRN